MGVPNHRRRSCAQRDHRPLGSDLQELADFLKEALKGEFGSPGGYLNFTAMAITSLVLLAVLLDMLASNLLRLLFVFADMVRYIVDRLIQLSAMRWGVVLDDPEPRERFEVHDLSITPKHLIEVGLLFIVCPVAIAAASFTQ